MTERLERGYRRLLRAYPPEYRAAREDEMVTTLLDAARPGQARPSAAETLDLLAGGARERLRDLAPAREGLAVAAAVSLAVCAGLSGFFWLVAELPWPFLTLAPIAYTAWLVAALCHVLVPRAGRWAVGLAMAVTAGLAVADPRPPMYVLGVLLLFGTVAAVGLPRAPSTRARVGVAGAMVVVGVTGVLVTVAKMPGSFASRSPDTVYWHVAAFGAVRTIQIVLAAVAVVGVARAVARRGAWLWAALMLLVPGAWLATSSLGQPRVVELEPGVSFLIMFPTDVAPRYLITSAVMLAAALWLATRRQDRDHPGRLVALAGLVSLLSAAGVAAYQISVSGPDAVLVMWLVAVTVALLGGTWTVRTVISAAVAVTAVASAMTSQSLAVDGGPMLLLGLVGLIGTWHGPPRRTARPRVVVVLAGALAAVFAVSYAAFPANVDGTVDGLASVGFALGLVAGAAALRSRRVTAALLLMLSLAGAAGVGSLNPWWVIEALPGLVVLGLAAAVAVMAPRVGATPRTAS